MEKFYNRLTMVVIALGLTFCGVTQSMANEPTVKNECVSETEFKSYIKPDVHEIVEYTGEQAEAFRTYVKIQSGRENVVAIDTAIFIQNDAGDSVAVVLFKDGCIVTGFPIPASEFTKLKLYIEGV